MQVQDQGGVVIGDDCLIGDNTVVAAGSFVTKDAPENAVVVGSPARVVRTRD